MRRCIQICLVSSALSLPALFLRGAIQLPGDAPDCVRWAAGEAQAALSAERPDLAVTVTIGHESTERGQQSFSLRCRAPEVALSAGGPLGAMYGLQEIAERCRNDTLADADQAPAVPLRADNPFIHVYPLQLNDLDYWRAYIDNLARCRFNLLDLHGAYDLATTSFPNLYPLLVHVPEYPQVGDEAQQAKNLADFRAIIHYAGQRGLKVAFMNYSANDGRGGAEKNAPSVTGVPPEKLADYTAKAVARLIRALPELSELGFRVGESGRTAEFYQQSYLKGIADAGRPDLRLYTRSWQTTQAQLEPIARAARAGFDIEVKYNGEHLGLPYQALQGAQFGTYSYQRYLDAPADYRIIWQVRANGTHRFWAWENTAFIRRTVGTFQLGRARGFTLEPPVAYFSTDPADYYRSAADRAVYRWIWQKHWMWYYAWGRLAYDPALPEDTLVREFSRHYGLRGPEAYAALQTASEVVPLVFADRFVGPDQRDISPETETGNALGKHLKQVPALLQFIDHPPMDARSFQSIADHVGAVLARRPDGRVTPHAVALKLTTPQEGLRRLLTLTERIHPAPLSPQERGEWRLLRDDLLCATWLGEYFGRRIDALTDLELALKTGDAAAGQRAEDGLAKSREAWKQLAQTADAVYAPLSNPLRRQTRFQWGQELAGLEKVDASVPALLAAAAAGKGAPPADPAKDSAAAPQLAIGDFSVQPDPAAGKITIACGAAAPDGVDHVELWYKPLPSEQVWSHCPMQESADQQRFSATVPLTNEGLMYLFEVVDRGGGARNFPDVWQETPYRVIDPY